jgi:hypothetical protein
VTWQEKRHGKDAQENGMPTFCTHGAQLCTLQRTGRVGHPSSSSICNGANLERQRGKRQSQRSEILPNYVSHNEQPETESRKDSTKKTCVRGVLGLTRTLKNQLDV